MHYILSHGAKEGLVGKPAEWPGPNCVAALTTGELLRGSWFDRSAEYIARQRGESVLPSQFATTFDVKLTPLPCLLHLTEDQRQAEFETQTRAPWGSELVTPPGGLALQLDPPVQVAKR